jgi:hypothetical protein
MMMKVMGIMKIMYTKLLLLCLLLYFVLKLCYSLWSPSGILV